MCVWMVWDGFGRTLEVEIAPTQPLVSFSIASYIILAHNDVPLPRVTRTSPSPTCSTSSWPELQR